MTGQTRTWGVLIASSLNLLLGVPGAEMEPQCSWNCFKVTLYWRTFKCALKVYESMFPSVEHLQVSVGRVGKACFAFGVISLWRSLPHWTFCDFLLIWSQLLHKRRTLVVCHDRVFPYVSTSPHFLIHFHLLSQFLFIFKCDVLSTILSFFSSKVNI